MTMTAEICGEKRLKHFQAVFMLNKIRKTIGFNGIKSILHTIDPIKFSLGAETRTKEAN
jgi:hypothetical protein